MAEEHEMATSLARIASALERLAPAAPQPPDLHGAAAFVWQAGEARLIPITTVNHLPLDLLLGIERQKKLLLDNSLRFAKGLPANNALLWGARGMGKSALIKAVHGEINRQNPSALALVEIHREDLAGLPQLLAILRDAPRRCLLFCDDLSFEKGDIAYKSLKAVLEGGIEGRPDNVLFYATSNRRHLMPREMMENERSTAIAPSEAVEESVSLSDRFGLWLGVPPCSQEDYLAMVARYCQYFALVGEVEEIDAAALEWAATRGARSGRVAWQFIHDLAGRQGRTLTPPGAAASARGR
ncbi:MAG: ATP-binding protein [Pseudomonadota bacterium]